MDPTSLHQFLSQDIAPTLSYLGAIQGVILAVIVWNYPQQHKISNRILSLFLLSLVYLYVGPRVLDLIDSPFQRLYYAFRTLAPLFLLFYIQSLHQKVLQKKYLLFLLLIPLDTLIAYFTIKHRLNGQVDSWDLNILSQIWFILIFALYLPFIYNQFRQYRFKVLQSVSSTQKIGLKWVNQLFFGFLFIMSFDFILSVVAGRYSFLDGAAASLISILAFTVFIYFITIKGKLSPQIYQLRNLPDSPQLDKSPISEEETKQLKLVAKKVHHLMETEKIFREEGLSVKEIADKIEEKPYVVSQAINTCLGKNFFELVNGYRVREAKKLMMDDSLSHLSMVGIAFEAGFSSKTAFNTAFKRHSGMTPSQFKKETTLVS
ncbi:helix-turn-helix domain-containing protein [Lunatibacter salilacus]|uniref:helix-turn-helix domain-containing protein n=1 Tax=Lunatibacter salilacus TaxID=2483804 RepID=UPI00131BD0DE|nr:helix-turn-helix domain-containing protein [Lunatibacter salilacus]